MYKYQLTQSSDNAVCENIHHFPLHTHMYKILCYTVILLWYIKLNVAVLSKDDPVSQSNEMLLCMWCFVL